MPERFSGGRNGAMTCWCVVRAQPHREVRAAVHLQGQGFRPFLPLQRKTVRHARQFRVVLRPLFPRYLFVELNVGIDPWTRIRGTAGVTQILMDGDRPRAVPKGVVERLVSLSDQRGVVDFDRTFRLGETVRLTAGPLAGLVGKLASLDDAGRVQVLLDILGKETIATGSVLGLVPAA